MEKVKNLLLKYFPILTIFIVTLVLFITNYKSGTYLTGWDNLHPEFNFGIAFKQAIFAVWQEHQGLGVLVAMQQASDFVHLLVLYLFSFIIPNSILRYFWTFLMLFSGGVGMYFLISRIILRVKIIRNEIIATLAALFYILNIATIQTFFTPFEPFIEHFAALPWIFFSLIYFLENKTRKALLLFILILFLTAPQAYLPTLFIVSMIAVTIYMFFYLLSLKTKDTLIREIKAYLIIFLTNAFWLFPFIYFSFIAPSTNIDSKINQTVTQTIFLRNKEFGDILNVALLKGFWFNNIDPNLSGVFTYMLGPWKDYFSSPFIIAIGLILFGIILIGVYYAVRYHFRRFLPFLALFVFSFGMLAVNTFPFSFANSLVRNASDLFNQLFRFPFTKFSSLTSFSYSIFFALGIGFIASFIESKNKSLNKIFYSVIFVLLLTISGQAFLGHFFYDKEKIDYPPSYKQLFDYFKIQDPNARIANLPQYSFWGWNFYSWGYGGSGFLWHGINQPILDRAFDVWGADNENYYWEISKAIYSKNPVLFEKVLNKYQVNFLLLDKNIINPQAPKSLYTPEIEQMISQIPTIHKDAYFGNLIVYKVSLWNQPKNYVFQASNLNTVNSYLANDFDQAFIDNSNYISSNNTNNEYYAFRSLLTSKEREKKDFTMTEEANSIDFTTKVPKDIKNSFISLPSPLANNKTIPASFTITKNGSETDLDIVLKTPQVIIKTPDGQEKNIWESSITQKVGALPQNISGPIILNVNGVTGVTIDKLIENKTYGNFTISNSESNVFIILDQTGKIIDALTMEPSSFSEFFSQQNSVIYLNKASKNSEIIIKVPKIEDNYSSAIINPSQEITSGQGNFTSCDNFRKTSLTKFDQIIDSQKMLTVESVNAKGCLSFLRSTLDHKTGYAIFVNSKNQKNLSFNFWILNEDQKYSPLNVYLDDKEKLTVSSFILPPQEDFGKSYSFHFDSESIGNDETINSLGTVNIFPIPYNFLSEVKIFGVGSITSEKNISINNLTVSHPNSSFYEIKTGSSSSDLILSQTYSEGWKLYSFNSKPNLIQKILPFIFGSENKNHEMINNWENGWKLPENSKDQNFIILYLPQYLEYLGFITTIIFIFTAVIRKYEKNNS